MKISKHFIAILSLITVLFASCSPDEYSLKNKEFTSKDLVQGLAFDIVPDESNPNIIHLKSLMSSAYTVLWETPQGRSQSANMDLQMPFPGEYYVRFGVETQGGVVYSDSTKFVVTTTCLAFVENDLWTYLTGGVGKSKEWVPNDYAYVDVNGYKTAGGELTYADPSTTVEFNNWASNWDPGKGVTADDGIFTSSMTFGLSATDGASVNIVNNTDGATPTESGSFMLDADAHTLSFTDCSILHTQSWDSKSSNWGRKLKILTLTENFLQVAIWRDTSSEGEWWMVLNFVAKDFKDNYVREAPTITLPDNWQTSISQNVVTTVKWTLSPKTPYNWALEDGSFENDWNSPADYPDWGQGTVDPARIGKFSMTLNSADNSAVFTDLSGATTSGTYSIGEDGWITFDGVEVPTFDITTGGGWSISFAGEGNTKLRVIKILYDNLGTVSGMWVGRWNKEGEYAVYCLDATSAASGAADPLAAWTKALSNKTFKIDDKWFVDWTGFDGTGGWTSDTTFGDDYTSNGWIYDATVRQVINTTSLTFTGSGSSMQAHLTYTKFDGTAVDETHAVTIDNDNSTIDFGMDLVDFTGTPAAWIECNNALLGTFFNKKALGTYEWPYMTNASSGNNLSNIDSKGFFLGRVSSALANGGDSNQLILTHWILAE